MKTAFMTQSRISAHWWRNAIIAGIASMLMLFAFSNTAHAYTYNSYSITDLNATSTNTAAGATTDITLTFTTPTAIPSGSTMYMYMPYLYDYDGGNYNSEYLNISGATITSSQFTASTPGTSYVNLTSNADLASGAAVTITIIGAVNPSSMEGTGTYSISMYDWDNAADTYTSVYGSVSQAFGEIDLTMTFLDADGTTPISGVNVNLSYYNTSNWSDYEYFYGYTNTSGQVQFAGLTAGRTYDVYTYYNGSTEDGGTDNEPPVINSYTNTAPGETATYTFDAANITTHFNDADGVAIDNAYYYLYKTDYTNYNTDYVWRYGYTDSTGLIKTSAPVDGNYTLQVADPETWSYYNFNFTVVGGVASGLADPIAIPSPEVSGTLYAGGVAQSGIYGWMYDSTYSNYRSFTTAADGTFEVGFGVTGTYKLEFSSWGLPDGYFAPAPQTIAVTGGVPNTPLTVNLQAATKTISGNITMKENSTANIAAGTPVTDAYVYAYQSGESYGWAQDTVDSSGNFSLTVTGGTWNVYIYQQSWPATWAYTGENMIVEFAKNDTPETSTLDIQVVPYDAHITGTITYPDGTPVGANAVYIYGYGSNVYSSAYTDANGAFDLSTTAGSFDIYLYFYNGTNNYSVPTVATQSVKSGETKSLGTIALVEKSSHIEGGITIRNTGDAVPNQYVYAYKQDGGWDSAYATTDSAGHYNLLVGPGDWTVYTYTWDVTTASGQKVIFSGGPVTVTVDDNETVSGQDFIFDIADATVVFTAKDTDGTELTSEHGWVSVTDSAGDYGYWGTGCYVNRGNCQLPLSSGVAYTVNYYSYNNWGWAGVDDTSYTYSGLLLDDVASTSMALTKDTTHAATLVMGVNDVTVTGQFLNQEGIAEAISGEVFAHSNAGGWAYAYVNNESSYTLQLSAGTWNLSYWTWGNWSWYGDNTNSLSTITVASGDTKTVNFSMLDNDATISGTVVDPNGDAITSPTFVKASTSYGTSDTATETTYGLVEQTTYTDDGGNFSMDVPSGTYFLTASSAEYLNPQPAEVTADTAGGATGLVLKFLASDATITGVVSDGVGITINNIRTLAVGDGVADAFVYAFSTNGADVNVRSDSAGAFSLPVTNGETWYIGAIYQSGNIAQYSEQSRVLLSSETTSQNLSLSSSLTLPDPVTVQFDPNEPVVTTLSNGVVINIPANAITAENIAQVTLVVTPVAEIAHEAGVAPVSIGYELNFTDGNNSPITQFASAITITLPYSESDLTDAGITEDDLSVGYYADAADAWQNVDGGVVIDTENNEFTVSVDHASKFAILSSKSILTGDEGEDTLLTKPNTPKATKRKPTKISLSWKAEENAASYEVQVTNVKTGTVKNTLAASSNAKMVKKLKSNKKYQFRVRSVGTSGSTSGWSDAKTLRTKPAKTKNVRVTNRSIGSRGAGTITLRWKKPRGTVKKYLVRIFDSTNKIVKKKKVKKKKTKIIGLDTGTRYSVRIKARFNKKNVSVFSKRLFFETVGSK